MPYNAAYPTFTKKSLVQLQWLWWAIGFFVLLNLAVWYVFDVRFGETVGFRRMLNNPTENELFTLLEEIEQDSRSHIVLLGDSVAAGVGLEEEDTFVLQLQQKIPSTVVINLAAPSESFVDQLAILQHLWRPEDTYIFFINPIWFQREPSVLFPTLVSQNLEAYPSSQPLQDTARSWLRRLAPLYRSRDTMNHSLLGIHPSVATRVALGRARATFTQRTNAATQPMNEGGELANVETTQQFTEITALLPLFAGKENIVFVILDDQWFDHGPIHQRSIQTVEELFKPHRVLNMQDMFHSSLFMDRTHLNAEGHTYLAELLYRLLHAS